MSKSPGIISRSSADEAIERFDTAEAASKYSRSLVGSRTHLQEERRIRRGLRGLPRGARVLDLPCGAGRLTPLLVDMGYKVISADSSAHMVRLAGQASLRNGLPLAAADFIVASVLATPFSDGEFDAVVCNRLFHHFRESEIRRQALRELKRICRGPIVVSFFCSHALDSVTFCVKQLLAKRRATDRIPISYRVFTRDCQAAGLKVCSIMPTRPGISKQWYLVLRADAGAA